MPLTHIHYRYCMKFTLQTTDWKKVRSSAIAFFVRENKRQTQDFIKRLGRTSVGTGAEALAAAGDMTGKKDELFVIYPKKSDTAAKRIFLVGMGKPESITLETIRRAA